jgi:hypothetical protein
VSAVSRRATRASSPSAPTADRVSPSAARPMTQPQLALSSSAARWQAKPTRVSTRCASIVVRRAESRAPAPVRALQPLRHVGKDSRSDASALRAPPVKRAQSRTDQRTRRGLSHRCGYPSVTKLAATGQLLMAASGPVPWTRQQLREWHKGSGGGPALTVSPYWRAWSGHSSVLAAMPAAGSHDPASPSDCGALISSASDRGSGWGGGPRRCQAAPRCRCPQPASRCARPRAAIDLSQPAGVLRGRLRRLSPSWCPRGNILAARAGRWCGPLPSRRVAA